MNNLKHIMAVLIITAMLATPLISQSNPIWVMLGVQQGVTFEINAKKDKTRVQSRNTFVEGKNKGIWWITKWDTDCQNQKIRQLEYFVYNSDNELIAEDKVLGAWVKPEEGSFAHVAMDKYWCRED